MRIAGTTISRHYLKNIERNLSNKFKSEQKINSFRQFQQASECPAQAASAMRVRKAISNLNNYQDNLKTADNIYSSAESSVIAISELIQSTYEKLIEAANGTHTEDQMEILATSVDTFADEAMRLMNLTVADRKIFGGTNNDTNAYAIKDGTVYYNDIPVNSTSDPTGFPYGNASYCDIGLGMTLDANGNIDEQSALQLTFNGAEILGCGVTGNSAFINMDTIVDGQDYAFDLTVGEKVYSVAFTGGASTPDNVTAINAALAAAVGNDRITVTDAGTISNGMSSDYAYIAATAVGSNLLSVSNVENGYSNNVIQNILDAAKAIREGDGTTIARFADQVFATQTTVSLALADIGNTSKFIEFNQTRITNNLESVTQRQNDLESTDIPSETTTWKMMESIYEATLQMSTSVIPMSIFQFI